MTRPSWAERIGRASELARRYPPAADVLEFYAAIAQFQEGFHARLGAEIPGGSLQGDPDVDLLIAEFPSLLHLIGEIAPAPLAERARALAARGFGAMETAIESAWNAQEQDENEAFFAMALLQPYAEALAERFAPSGGHERAPFCPVCERPPVTAVLRPCAEGAARSLICSLCATEWDFQRLVCIACGEESSLRLSVYRTHDFPHLRLETCDTCKHYIATVDLTVDGAAVPVVDELAGIPLNLWAQENGYSKLQPNLLGI